MVVDVELGAGGGALFFGWLGWVDEGGEKLVGLAGVAEILPGVVVLVFKDSDGVDVLGRFGDGGGFGGDEFCGDVVVGGDG